MKAVKLDLPTGVEVRGELLSGRHPDCMLQDILELKLPTGISIDVGWHPESDPSGSYRVVVFRDYWRNQLQPPVLTKSICDLVTIVETLAREYSQSGRTTVLDETSGRHASVRATSCSSGKMCRAPRVATVGRPPNTEVYV